MNLPEVSDLLRRGLKDESDEQVVLLTQSVCNILKTKKSTLTAQFLLQLLDWSDGFASVDQRKLLRLELARNQLLQNTLTSISRKDDLADTRFRLLVWWTFGEMEEQRVYMIKQHVFDEFIEVLKRPDTPLELYNATVGGMWGFLEFQPVQELAATLTSHFLRDNNDSDLIDRQCGCVHLITSREKAARHAYKDDRVLEWCSRLYPDMMQSRYFCALILANLLHFAKGFEEEDEERSEKIRGALRRHYNKLDVKGLRDIEKATEMRWASLEPFFVLLNVHSDEEFVLLTGLVALAVILGLKMNLPLLNDEQRNILVAMQFCKFDSVRKFWKDYILPVVSPYEVPPLKYLINH